MALLTRPITLAEGWWAQHHVHLLPEPAGERQGLVNPEDFSSDQAPSATPITLTVAGDSMVGGCGVEAQSQGFVPRIARHLANRTGRPVQWHAYGKLGATMRRVRFRQLPEIKHHSDLLILCAGSNDVMAGRTADEWKADLTAAIEEARPLADRLVVLGPGQTFNSPALHRLAALRAYLLQTTDAQIALSESICKQENVTYFEMAHEPFPAELWASDGFHPNADGYELMATKLVNQL